VQCGGASKRSPGHVKKSRQPDHNPCGPSDPRRQVARPEALIDAYLDHIAHRDPAVRGFTPFDPAKPAPPSSSAKLSPLICLKTPHLIRIGLLKREAE
jgi:hypothetical protein